MKITELAKELKMTGEEVLEKAKAMGVPVAKTSDDMSDMDTVAVRNTLTKGSGKAETKVARKTATKKTVAEKKNEPKVTKQANLKMPEKRTTKKAAGLGTVQTKPAAAAKTKPAAAPTGKAKPPVGAPKVRTRCFLSA